MQHFWNLVSCAGTTCRDSPEFLDFGTALAEIATYATFMKNVVEYGAFKQQEILENNQTHIIVRVELVSMHKKECKMSTKPENVFNGTVMRFLVGARLFSWPLIFSLPLPSQLLMQGLLINWSALKWHTTTTILMKPHLITKSREAAKPTFQKPYHQLQKKIIEICS